MGIWEIVLVVHLLAMAFFVGGQIMLAGVLVPVFRGREEMKVVARRFGAGSVIALGILILTGMLMASHEKAWGEAILMAKLGVLTVLVIALGYHMHNGTKRWLDPVIAVLSITIVVLGVALAEAV